MIKHLREMEFEVLAFSNLTVGEIHQALELFCRFIDEQTSVFFYFNGHAFAYGSDIYLVGKDTPYPITAIDGQLVWHGIGKGINISRNFCYKNKMNLVIAGLLLLLLMHYFRVIALILEQQIFREIRI